MTASNKKCCRIIRFLIRRALWEEYLEHTPTHDLNHLVGDNAEFAEL